MRENDVAGEHVETTGEMRNLIKTSMGKSQEK
jgi:hypothetical protein